MQILIVSTKMIHNVVPIKTKAYVKHFSFNFYESFFPAQTQVHWKKFHFILMSQHTYL